MYTLKTNTLKHVLPLLHCQKLHLYAQFIQHISVIVSRGNTTDYLQHCNVTQKQIRDLFFILKPCQQSISKSTHLMPSVVESFGPPILFHCVVQLRFNLMFSKYMLQAPMNTKSDILICDRPFQPIVILSLEREIFEMKRAVQESLLCSVDHEVFLNLQSKLKGKLRLFKT